VKWVLVRSRIGNLYVLQRREWEVYAAQDKHYGEHPSTLVAESNDRDELVRFKQLTEEA
jgi:hypothetical protein